MKMKILPILVLLVFLAVGRKFSTLPKHFVLPPASGRDSGSLEAAPNVPEHAEVRRSDTIKPKAYWPGITILKEYFPGEKTGETKEFLEFLGEAESCASDSRAVAKQKPTKQVHWEGCSLKMNISYQQSHYILWHSPLSGSDHNVKSINLNKEKIAEIIRDIGYCLFQNWNPNTGFEGESRGDLCPDTAAPSGNGQVPHDDGAERGESTPWPGLDVLHLLAKKATPAAAAASLLSYLESAKTCETSGMHSSKDCTGLACKALVWEGHSCDQSGTHVMKSLVIEIQPGSSSLSIISAGDSGNAVVVGFENIEYTPEEAGSLDSIFQSDAANVWPGLAILRSAALASPPRLAYPTAKHITWREDWLLIARRCLGWHVSHFNIGTDQQTRWEGSLCWDEKTEKIVWDMRVELVPSGGIFESYEINPHGDLWKQKKSIGVETEWSFSTELQKVRNIEEYCLFESRCPWPGLSILKTYYEEQENDADEEVKKAAALMLNYLGAAETCPVATSSALKSDTVGGHRKVQWAAEGCNGEHSPKMEMSVVERESDYALEHPEMNSDEVFTLLDKETIADIEKKVGASLFQDWNSEIVSEKDTYSYFTYGL